MWRWQGISGLALAVVLTGFGAAGCEGDSAQREKEIHDQAAKAAAQAKPAVEEASRAVKAAVEGAKEGWEKGGKKPVDLNSASEEDLTALRRTHIGFVFQFFQLLPALTALENVELPLLLAGAAGARKAARDRLAWVDLAEKADSFPYQLSGGQMQRVAIARALVHMPDILIADEPTGNLDNASGDQVLALLREAALRFGATVLMATHSAEAAAIAQTSIQMRDGRITALERA